MAFEGKSKREKRAFSTPEELFLSGELKRTGAAVPNLWVHQGDVIREYAANHVTTPDLALELPTGSGKTLPGALIGDWVRRKGEGPVAYATPTTQLARQVLATVKREGIPVVLLTGRYREWSVEDQSAYEGGEALAITNYSTVFNSSPKLEVPRLLILDDAHAGEQFVADQYAVDLRRRKNEDAYLAVLDALAPLLSGLLLQRLRGEPDPGAHHQVRLLLPAVDDAVLGNLDTALSKLEGDQRYQLAMIRGGLHACCVYLSYGGIQIRPVVPPTFENAVFTGAQQRIYLSATLGTGGELERAFGRREIVRMPLPGQTPPRSGRRLFVFPDLAAGDDPDILTKKVVAVTDKALVLAQDTIDNTEAVASQLAGAGVPLFKKSDVENDLAPFTNADKGILGLANRYDGLDLPGDACRMVVLAGRPDASSLQEKFLGQRADANAALAERLRTRIVQGAGRCTRGPSDYAVVVVRGSDITRYFSRTENREALEPELQAEIEFGWTNSRGKTHEQILENVEIFLEHDDAWRDGGEPMLAEFRQDAHKVEPPGTEALGNAASEEVAAWEAAHAGDFGGASEHMQEAARRVGAGGDATRGYRGFLLYVAGAWLNIAATGEAQRARARELIRQATAAAADRGGWLREMPDLPGVEIEELAGADAVAVAAIAAQLKGRMNHGKVTAELRQMQTDLDQDESTAYEGGLEKLGRYLGASASKPPGDGRCDSAWEWDMALWVTLEAKSEQDDDGLVALRYVRQANTQLDQLATDRSRDHAPAGSLSVIVSDRTAVDPEHAPVANPNLYLATPATVLEVARDVTSAWTRLLTGTAGVTQDIALRGHVEDVLRQHGCLPTQVTERLSQNRIRPGR